MFTQMRVKNLATGSIVYGKLPRGCMLCQQGLKTIIFLTGLCPCSCFYCPLSEYRRQRDLIIVNETEITNPFEYFKRLEAEILKSGSKGASLTGGDPLLKHQLAVQTISYLKDQFGEKFHVHIYTTGLLLKRDRLKELADVGLNELRIHAPLDKLEEALKLAREWGDKLSVGLEYPALPRSRDFLLKLLNLAEKYEVDFINLNQLEFTESNSLSLQLRGFKLSKDYRAAEGSEEAALELIRYAESVSANTTVHYCPVRVKDHFQTGLRFYRNANLVAMTHQLVTEAGTLIEVMYDELGPYSSKYRQFYPAKYLHPLLIDLVKKGKILEEAPSVRKLVLEETPFNHQMVPRTRGGAF